MKSKTNSFKVTKVIINVIYKTFFYKVILSSFVTLYIQNLNLRSFIKMKQLR